jgi:hypothetical protein
MKRFLIGLALVVWATPALAQANLQSALEAIRPSYPTPMSPAQLAEMLNRVAWDHRAEGWGLLAKPSGNNCPMANGVLISCDFLVYQPTAQGWDVLTASDTDAIPSWQGPYPIDLGRFVAPIPPPAPPTGFGDVPVPGEYDGDGRPDIAVYRPTTGEWFIAQSSGGARVVTWGTREDIPVPTDYDGDRRTDIAVYRPSTGQWFIINSSTNTATVMAFGSPASSGLRDMPLAGDYDRDGKADLGIYRRSTGEWFIRRSSDGGVSKITWGAP